MALVDFWLDLSRLTSLSRAYPLPCLSPGGWALTEEACQFVGAFVRWYEAGRVLEFGSGFSSLVISSEFARHEHGALDSIDNSPRWSGTACELAREHALLERIEFHRFPLGLSVYGGVPYVFYKIPSAFYGRRAPYDLVIVDGPHHDVSRDGALPESFARLRTRGYLLLDDCHSDHMPITCSERWQNGRCCSVHRSRAPTSLISEMGSASSANSRRDHRGRCPSRRTGSSGNGCGRLAISGARAGSASTGSRAKFFDSAAFS